MNDNDLDNIINDCFNEFNNIEHLKTVNTFLVAVSGGIDSLSLTLIANEWAIKNNKKIIAITVDHKLRSTSTYEANYVNEILTKNNIEHYILTWNDEKPKTNIENIAREARYNLIFDFCKKHNINTIFLGHHIQDQAENFLIRLFRGSGITGLSSMQKISNRNGFVLVRPFLYLKKDNLKKYLLQNNIKWIEDESNTDEKYLRNKIRTFLNSFNEKDNIINRINSTVNTLQLANSIINEKISELEKTLYLYNNEYNYYTINAFDFLNLNKELKYRILIKIIQKITNNQTNLRFIKIENFLNMLSNFNCFKKYTLSGCIFEKINETEFVCYREYNSIKNKTNYLKKGELNKYLNFLKKNNYQQYKKIKNFKGYMKEILYTIPITFKN